MRYAFACPVVTVLGALGACSSSSSPGVGDGDPGARTGPIDAGNAFDSGQRQDSQVDASANDAMVRDGSPATASDGSSVGDAPSDGGFRSAATFVSASWQGGGRHDQHLLELARRRCRRRSPSRVDRLGLRRRNGGTPNLFVHHG